MTALAIIHRDKIIQDIASGKRIKDIAAELGITGQAISQNLAHDPEYQAAQLSFHSNRLDTAEHEIENADDQLTLARAQALWKAYSWRASVEQSRIWGNQAQANTNFGQGGITINIGSVEPNVYEVSNNPSSGKR